MIKKYIVYTEDGLIRRTGVCPESALSLQAQEGEFVMEGEARDDLHMIVNGEVVAKPPPEPPSTEELKIECMEILRYIRNGKLKNSDWTQSADSPLTDSKKAEWATYRQALRNLPSQHLETTDIASVTWPSRPTS